MTNHVAPVIQLVGTSDTGIKDATDVAVAQPGETVRHMRWFKVEEPCGAITDDEVERYQAAMKVGFSFDEDAASD